MLFQRSAPWSRGTKKNVRNDSPTHDHGQRCRRFSPFLHSTSHYNASGLCVHMRGSTIDRKSVCRASRDEKNQQTWQNDHFSWKMRTAKATKKLPTFMLDHASLHSGERGTSTFSLLGCWLKESWRKICPRSSPEKSGKIRAWPCSARWHENHTESCRKCQGWCRKYYPGIRRRLGTANNIDLAAWDMPGSKCYPWVFRPVTHVNKTS